MSQTVEKNDSKDVSTSRREEIMSEESNQSDDMSQTDNQRAFFSMALSVILASILLQSFSILSGLLVGISLWFVISALVSKTLKIAGWTGEDDEMTDMEVLEEAYKRGLVSEEQFEESVERSSLLD